MEFQNFGNGNWVVKLNCKMWDAWFMRELEEESYLFMLI